LDITVTDLDLYPSGPAAAAVVGAIRGSARLHWTQREARAEAQGWIAEMAIGPFDWETVNDHIVIGRDHSRVVILRAILLPLGAPP
jgi:hypothetical protein